MKAENQTTGHNRFIKVTGIDSGAPLQELELDIRYRGDGGALAGVTLDSHIIPAILSGLNDPIRSSRKCRPYLVISFINGLRFAQLAEAVDPECAIRGRMLCRSHSEIELLKGGHYRAIAPDNELADVLVHSFDDGLTTGYISPLRWKWLSQCEKVPPRKGDKVNAYIIHQKSLGEPLVCINSSYQIPDMVPDLAYTSTNCPFWEELVKNISELACMPRDNIFSIIGLSTMVPPF